MAPQNIPSAIVLTFGNKVVCLTDLKPQFPKRTIGLKTRSCALESILILLQQIYFTNDRNGSNSNK